MEAQPVFSELFELLNKHSVEYVIAGTYTLSLTWFP